MLRARVNSWSSVPRRHRSNVLLTNTTASSSNASYELALSEVPKSAANLVLGVDERRISQRYRGLALLITTFHVT